MGNNRYFPAQDAPGYSPHFHAQGADDRVQHAPQYHAHAATGGYAPEPPLRTAQPYGAAGYGASYAPHPPYPNYAPAAPRPATHAPEPVAPVGLGSVAHALGAVLSVALIVGAGGWVWQMMKRDVAGVPVVRALEGPVRVAPDDPGGRQAAHQGLSVNGLAAATDEAPREQIVLAPAPLDLTGDDLVAPPPSSASSSAPALSENLPIPVALSQEVPTPAIGVELGLQNPTRRAVAQSPRPAPREAGTVAQAREASLRAPAQSGNMSDDLAASVANSVAAGLSSTREIDVDPATIGPGTRLVQLGAYDDAATARAAWDQLSRRFSPLLEDRGRVIEAAHSGGSVFYRLRAHGFTDERDARRFCAALVDQQIDCIPVLIR